MLNSNQYMSLLPHTVLRYCANIGRLLEYLILIKDTDCH